MGRIEIQDFVVAYISPSAPPCWVRGINWALRRNDGVIYPRPFLTLRPQDALHMPWATARSLQCELVARVDCRFQVVGPVMSPHQGGAPEVDIEPSPYD